MSKIIAIGVFAVLALIASTKNVQGVHNYNLPKSYIDQCLDLFRRIINNESETAQIHKIYTQHTQDTNHWEPIAQAADIAYASYQPLLSRQNVIQRQWRNIRNAYTTYITQISDFIAREMLITQQETMLRTPMINFTNLYSETVLIMASRGQEGVQQRVNREQELIQQLTIRMVADRARRGQELAIYDPKDPSQSFNPVNMEPEDNSYQFQTNEPTVAVYDWTKHSYTNQPANQNQNQTGTVSSYGRDGPHQNAGQNNMNNPYGASPSPYPNHVANTNVNGVNGAGSYGAQPTGAGSYGTQPPGYRTAVGGGGYGAGNNGETKQGDDDDEDETAG